MQEPLRRKDGYENQEEAANQNNYQQLTRLDIHMEVRQGLTEAFCLSSSTKVGCRGFLSHLFGNATGYVLEYRISDCFGKKSCNSIGEEEGGDGNHDQFCHELPCNLHLGESQS